LFQPAIKEKACAVSAEQASFSYLFVIILIILAGYHLIFFVMCLQTEKEFQFVMPHPTTDEENHSLGSSTVPLSETGNNQ